MRELRCQYYHGDGDRIRLWARDPLGFSWEGDHTFLPTNLNPVQVFQHADRFVLYFAAKRPPVAVTYSRQKLINSYRRALRYHRDLLELAQMETRRERSEDTAGELLKNLNNELFEAVKARKPFYLQGQQYTYIVHPQSRQIIALLPDHPASLCIYVTDQDVQSNVYDWMIAMWKYIIGAEDKFLSTANKFDRFPSAFTEALDKIKL